MPSSNEYIGSYRLLNLVRTGKTCQVWEVMHDVRSTRLAIKLLLSEFRDNRDEVNFLKHEYEVGRKLEHPNVIQSYEFGHDREQIYLAMELFAAPNIKQSIHLGVENLAPVLPRVIEQAAEGLEYFHSEGWVHRDIKPDNFLMKPDGETKLIDFALAVRQKRGLARFFGGKGKIQGTRSYMSPEQIRCQALDERADIYSFGCMVHELVAGKPPYTGVSTADLLNKHLKSAPPSLLSANRNVTEDFAQLVRSMLSKAPAGRPATMTDFLREFRSVEVFRVPPATVRR